LADDNVNDILYVNLLLYYNRYVYLWS